MSTSTRLAKLERNAKLKRYAVQDEQDPWPPDWLAVECDESSFHYSGNDADTRLVVDTLNYLATEVWPVYGVNA